MDAATIQLIIALLPMAENLVFNIGGQMVKIATSHLDSPESVAQALDAAKAAGFPQLSFVTPAAPGGPVSELPVSLPGAAQILASGENNADA
jgi:hypothetical protein